MRSLLVIFVSLKIHPDFHHAMFAFYISRISIYIIRTINQVHYKLLHSIQIQQIQMPSEQSLG